MREQGVQRVAGPVRVLAVLQDGAQRGGRRLQVEVPRPDQLEGRGPVQRLGHPGRLEQVQAAQPLHRLGHLLGQLGRQLRHPGLEDRDLAGEVGVLEPEVETAALERVVHLAGAVGGEDDQRRRLRAHHADLGDRHRVLRQHLEQERLELVVGAVDLVDEQHARRGLQRLEHRPGEQETAVVEGGLDGVGVQGGARRGRRGLHGAQVQQLAGEVPVVERLRRVDALVALQPHERRAEHLGEGQGERGLAGPRLALAEQRSPHAQGEERRRGESGVGEVPGALEGGGDDVGPGQIGGSGHHIIVPQPGSRGHHEGLHTGRCCVTRRRKPCRNGDARDIPLLDHIRVTSRATSPLDALSRENGRDRPSAAPNAVIVPASGPG